MSKKSFEKCKKDILEKQSQNSDFDIDDALELVDNYTLTTEELDAIFEIIRGDNESQNSIKPVETELQKLYDKYGVILQRKKRIYLEPLNTRDYLLENTIPYCLKYKDFSSTQHSWGNLLVEFVEYCEYIKPKEINQLLDFNVNWSKQKMFSTEKKTNHKKIGNNLFLNCNHSALHSCWLLQDIVMFYDINVDDVNLYIHRSCTSEPKELITKVENNFKEEFSSFLQEKYNKSAINAEKIISNIENAMNPRLARLSATYPNFFLFDDYLMLSSYTYKFEEKIDDNLKINSKTKSIFKRYLSYLRDFYKTNGY